MRVPECQEFGQAENVILLILKPTNMCILFSNKNIISFPLALIGVSRVI